MWEAEQQRRAALGGLGHQPQGLLLDRWVESYGRLIQQQSVRVVLAGHASLAAP